MFEKEAEERAEKLAEKQTLGVYDNDEDLARDEGWNDGYVSGYEEGFQNGAEFGYNKANEWHYVTDGDLPNKGVLCAVLLVNNDLIFARLREDNVWTTNGHNAFENVIAWKEIVLPELKEKRNNDSSRTS